MMSPREDGESSEEVSSSSDEEEENPTKSGEPQSFLDLKDAPATVESPKEKEDAPATVESPEERKERLRRELNDRFKENMRKATIRVEEGKPYTATRTVVSLYNGLAFAFSTPSEVQTEDLKDVQLLGAINRETLDSLDKHRESSEQYKVLLESKEKYLEAERIRKDQEIVKKVGWVQAKLTEVRAEEGALDRMMKFHESVEDYVVKSMKELRNMQSSEEAQEINWEGLQFGLSKEGGEQLSAMTIYEKLFSERLSTQETNLVTEMEVKLRELEKVITVDLEGEEKASLPSAEGAGSTMAPPEVPAMKKEPVGTPKTEAMPKPQQEKQKEEEKKKKEEELQEQKKREADAASAAEKGYGKRAKHEYPDAATLVNSKTIPKDYLYVEATQDLWDLLGVDSRERLLTEKESSGACFFCGYKGHRAYACSRMLRLACSWGQLTGQAQFGGNERQRSLWCSSCAFANSVKAVAQNTDIRKASGWFVHTRSTCRSRDECPLLPDEDLCKLSSAELLKHMKDVGVFGKEGEPKGTKSL